MGGERDRKEGLALLWGAAILLHNMAFRNESRSVHNSSLVILGSFRGSSWLSELSPPFPAWKRKSVVIGLLTTSPAPAHTTAWPLGSSDFSDGACLSYVRALTLT